MGLQLTKKACMHTKEATEAQPAAENKRKPENKFEHMGKYANKACHTFGTVLAPNPLAAGVNVLVLHLQQYGSGERFR
jgi:hypothetical protein